MWKLHFGFAVFERSVHGFIGEVPAKKVIPAPAVSFDFRISSFHSRISRFAYRIELIAGRGVLPPKSPLSGRKRQKVLKMP
jgi:hypothetical protein